MAGLVLVLVGGGARRWSVFSRSDWNINRAEKTASWVEGLYYKRQHSAALQSWHPPQLRTWVAVYSRTVTDHSPCTELAHYPGLPLRVLERVWSSSLQEHPVCPKMWVPAPRGGVWSSLISLHLCSYSCSRMWPSFAYLWSSGGQLFECSFIPKSCNSKMEDLWISKGKKTKLLNS